MKKSLLSLAALSARLLPDPIKRWVYRYKPLAKLVRNTLNKAAPIGFTAVVVAAGEVAGAKMQLDLQSEKDYWLGTYETDLQQTVTELIQPGWVAYDVGANIGFISLLLAKMVGETGQVFSFEALPTNLERLRTHIAMNGLASRVIVVPKAVVAASESVRFLIGPSGAMGKAEGSAGRSDGHHQAIEVPGISLDDFVYQEGNPTPQVIKMDIEGGEVLALKGMTRLFEKTRPLILLELHGPEAAQTAWETLTAAGYSLHRMQRGYPQVSSFNDLDWKAYLVAKP